MRSEDKQFLLRLALCMIIIIIAGAIGAVVSNSNRVRVIPPGEATEAQVQAAVTELREYLREAGRSQIEINCMVHQLKCKYLPETTEGCENVEESCKAEEERKVQDREP